MTEQEIYFSDVFFGGFSFTIRIHHHVLLHTYLIAGRSFLVPQDRLMIHTLKEIVEKE